MKEPNESLLGYLLDSLDEADLREVEGYAGSAAGQERLDMLRRAVEPLAADREDRAPPPDLFYRTLARVAEYASQRDLPRAPAASPVHVHFRAPWRRVELLVAASILLVALGTLASGLVHLRNSSAYVECQNNLRVFYTALRSYHDGHRQFPDVKAEAPHDAAGMLVPILVDAGVLNPGEVNVRCPGNGTVRRCPVTYQDAKELDEDGFDRVAPRLMASYAYSLGYFDEDGVYHPPHLRDGLDSHIPLLSDRPPYGNGPGNSPNHNGTGQNVLFQDGHVAYRSVRSLDFDDDIFLNRAHQVRAASDPNDNCLGPSNSRP